MYESYIFYTILKWAKIQNELYVWKCIWRSIRVCSIWLFDLWGRVIIIKLFTGSACWLSFSSKATYRAVCLSRSGGRWPVWGRATYCSNRACTHPAATGPRAERAPINSGSPRTMIRARGMFVMKAGIVASPRGGVRVQGQFLTRMMISPRLSFIASQAGGQMLRELRHE